jgi:hypothetical protein
MDSFVEKLALRTSMVIGRQNIPIAQPARFD